MAFLNTRIVLVRTCIRALGSRALFFFNDTATTEIYTLSLHDALPISSMMRQGTPRSSCTCRRLSSASVSLPRRGDRKSTRLNSSHLVISYAVFCLKKKTRYYLALLNRMQSVGLLLSAVLIVSVRRFDT